MLLDEGLAVSICLWLGTVCIGILMDKGFSNPSFLPRGLLTFTSTILSIRLQGLQISPIKYILTRSISTSWASLRSIHWTTSVLQLCGLYLVLLPTFTEWLLLLILWWRLFCVFLRSAMDLGECGFIFLGYTYPCPVGTPASSVPTLLSQLQKLHQLILGAKVA